MPDFILVTDAKEAQGRVTLLALKGYTVEMIAESRHQESGEGEQSLSLGDLLQIIRRRLWAILLTMVVLTGLAVGISLLQTPEYEASVMILVGKKETTVDPFNLGGEITGLQQLTETLAEAVGSRPVAEGVIQQLGLQVTSEEFLESVSVHQIATTQFIQVDYRDTDPVRAQQIANTIGNVFSEQVSEVSPDAGAVTATVWEQAAVPEYPVSPNFLLNALLGLILGAMLGMGLAFLLEYQDDTWQSPEEVEQISGVPNYGVIPEFKVPKGKVSRGKKGGDQDVRVSPESRT